jgi:hypothetical protein
MTLLQLRKALREHRLSRLWSYDELATQMGQALGVDGISAATMRRFAEGYTAPHATTTYVVRRYLAQVSGKAAA